MHTHPTHRVPPGGQSTSLLAILLLAAAFTGSAQKTSAQSLNWEGQNGIFVTPLAYSVPGKQNGFDWPAVSYHYVNAGSVIGGFHQNFNHRRRLRSIRIRLHARLAPGRQQPDSQPALGQRLQHLPRQSRHLERRPPHSSRNLHRLRRPHPSPQHRRRHRK